MNNVYVKFRVKQVIGIPMGRDCASKVSGLFLHWCKHDLISKAVTKPEVLKVIYVLKYCSRYIDDLNFPYASDKMLNYLQGN